MHGSRLRLPRVLITPALVLSVALVAAACSGAGAPAASQPAASVPVVPEPAATSPAAPAGGACEDLVALRASIEALGEVDLTADGAAALLAAVTEVKAAAEALESSASTELAAVAATFRAQVDDLQTAADQLGSGDGSGLVAVGAAIAGLVGAARDLEAQFQTACP